MPKKIVTLLTILWVIALAILCFGCGGFSIIVYPKADDGTLIVEADGRGRGVLKLKDHPDYTEIEIDSKSEPFIKKVVGEGTALILSREAGGAPASTD